MFSEADKIIFKMPDDLKHRTLHGMILRVENNSILILVIEPSRKNRDVNGKTFYLDVDDQIKWNVISV